MRKRITVHCDWDTQEATIIIKRFGGKKSTYVRPRHAASCSRLCGILQNSPNIYYTHYGHVPRGQAAWHKSGSPNFHYYYKAIKSEREYNKVMERVLFLMDSNTNNELLSRLAEQAEQYEDINYPL